MYSNLRDYTASGADLKTKELLKLVKGRSMNDLQLKCLSAKSGLDERKIKRAMHFYDQFMMEHEVVYIQGMYESLLLQPPVVTRRCHAVDSVAVTVHDVTRRAYRAIQDSKGVRSRYRSKQAKAIISHNIHVIVGYAKPVYRMV